MTVRLIPMRFVRIDRSHPFADFAPHRSDPEVRSLLGTWLLEDTGLAAEDQTITNLWSMCDSADQFVECLSHHFELGTDGLYAVARAFESGVESGLDAWADLLDDPTGGGLF